MHAGCQRRGVGWVVMMLRPCSLSGVRSAERCTRHPELLRHWPNQRNVRSPGAPVGQTWMNLFRVRHQVAETRT